MAYVQRQSADGNDDIWVKDLKTFNASQITTVLDDDRSPVWGKDDKYILFVSEREGNFDIWSADVSKLK
ncbi:MAG: PD40 domain-containing protein [Planctomycetes bacterium]|nr:PD40 domain-containing protein [Planctomycetota bacterium]